MKALLIAPFWRRPNHLSAVRTERFIRWLKSDGWEIVLVRAGEMDQVFEQPWGVEIAIKDPLGLHPEQTAASEHQAQKQYSRSTQLAAALLFNPDPGILWARRAARHPLVLEHGKNADIVLSSSPPESAHLCAARSVKTSRRKVDDRHARRLAGRTAQAAAADFAAATHPGSDDWNAEYSVRRIKSLSPRKSGKSCLQKDCLLQARKSWC